MCYVLPLYVMCYGLVVIFIIYYYWMVGVRAAMTTRHLEADQWLNRKEWRLGT